MDLAIVGSESSLTVSDVVFAREFNEPLVHQVVVAYRNAARSGTKAQKSRSEVSGTTKKSKKQKGGGARHGALTAPIFVGGGVTFAAKPRNFSQKVNRRQYRSAICSIFSELNRQSRLKVVDAFDVEVAKTKVFAEKIKPLREGSRLLLLSDNVPNSLSLASRNLPYVDVRNVRALDPVALVVADMVVITVGAVKKIEEWLV
ncbi:MAG TPA: 50S ribosomal protein L4 [Xylella sp.]